MICLLFVCKISQFIQINYSYIESNFLSISDAKNYSMNKKFIAFY